MIVQELFQKTTFEEFLNYFEKKINKRINKQEKLREIFEDLKNYKNTKKQNKVLFTIQDSDEKTIDIFYFKKNHFPKNLQIYNSIEEMQENYQNQGVSILGIDRYEVLGFEFAENCLQELTIPNIVSELFFEMTYFGLNYENSKKKIKEFHDELIKSIDEIENSKTISLEEFMSEFGIKDERTEEEKEQERKKSLENCLKNVNKTNQIILDYLKENLYE